MKQNPTSQSGLFNPRILVAFALCSVGAVVAADTCVEVPMGINACPTWVSTYNYPPNDGSAYADADVANAEAVSPSGDRAFVTGASFDPTGTYGPYPQGSSIATIAYDAATGAQLWVARYTGAGHHQDTPYAIAVSPDGSRIYVTGGQNHDVINQYEPVGDCVTIAYDAATGAQLWSASYQAPGLYLTLCCGLAHNQYSTGRGIAVSPDGSRVAVTGLSGQSPGDGSDTALATLLYDASTGAQLWAQRYDDPNNGPNVGRAVAFSPDATQAATERPVGRHATKK
jgi:DNA-binding beta-propeller fold protein YncE